MNPDEQSLRESLVTAARRLDVLGLNRGSTGNLSHRFGGGMFITPTGATAEDLGPEDLVWVGPGRTRRGLWEPSSEWLFHNALYAVRPEFNAIVHTHSVHATALACLKRGIPAFHYMVAVAGGVDIRCAPYRLFGTDALSQVVQAAMTDRKACLLAHHGLVAAGVDLPQAMKIAIEVEALAESYLEAAAVGVPPVLSPEEMSAVIEKFRSYGKTQSRA